MLLEWLPFPLVACVGRRLGGVLRVVVSLSLGRVLYPHRSFKSSQVNTLPIAKSQIRSKQNKGMHKFSSAYGERGVPLPILTSGGE
jgi:hypothetical protein